MRIIKKALLALTTGGRKEAKTEHIWNSNCIKTGAGISKKLNVLPADDGSQDWLDSTGAKGASSWHMDSSFGGCHFTNDGRQSS